MYHPVVFSVLYILGFIVLLCVFFYFLRRNLDTEMYLDARKLVFFSVLVLLYFIYIIFCIMSVYK